MRRAFFASVGVIALAIVASIASGSGGGGGGSSSTASKLANPTVLSADSATAPSGGTIRGGNATGGTANVSGGTVVVQGGKSTGNGSSTIDFQASPVGSSGATGPIAPTSFMTIYGNDPATGAPAIEFVKTARFNTTAVFGGSIVVGPGNVFTMNASDIRDVRSLGYDGAWGTLTPIVATGSTQANGAQLPSPNTNSRVLVSVAASNGAKAVVLPTGGTIGCEQVMSQVTGAANTLVVFPGVGGTVNGAAANASYAQMAGTSLTYCTPDGAAWTTY